MEMARQTNCSLNCSSKHRNNFILHTETTKKSTLFLTLMIYYLCRWVIVTMKPRWESDREIVLGKPPVIIEPMSFIYFCPSIMRGTEWSISESDIPASVCVRFIGSLIYFGQVIYWNECVQIKIGFGLFGVIWKNLNKLCGQSDAFIQVHTQFSRRHIIRFDIGI